MFNVGDLVKVKGDPTYNGDYPIDDISGGLTAFQVMSSPVTKYAGRVGRISTAPHINKSDFYYLVELDWYHHILVPYYSLEKLDHA